MSLSPEIGTRNSARETTLRHVGGNSFELVDARQEYRFEAAMGFNAEIFDRIRSSLVGGNGLVTYITLYTSDPVDRAASRAFPMRGNLLILCASCLLISAASHSSAQPSFDCANALHADEVVICKNDDLAAREKLGEQTFTKLFHLPNMAQPAIEARSEFIAARHKCGFEVDCIRREQDAFLDLLAKEADPNFQPVAKKLFRPFAEDNTVSHSHSSAQPSFDCASALDADEIVICKNDDLAARDKLGEQTFTKLFQQPNMAQSAIENSQ